jgi:valyl-tRNA synthetase
VTRLAESPEGEPPARAASSAEATEPSVAERRRREDLALSDRWILSRLQRATRAATEAFEGFRYHEAIRTVYEFVWNEFCAWYVELTKFRLKEGGRGAEAARSVLAHVLDRSLRFLHPVCPFITEELWARLGEVRPSRELDLASSSGTSERVVVARWPEPDESLVDDGAERTMLFLQDVVTAVRNVRSERNVRPRDEVPVAVSCRDEAAAEELSGHRSIVARLACAGPVEVGVDLGRPDGAAVAVLDRAQVFVTVAGDAAAERGKLEKQKEREEAHLRKIDGRLRNQQYLDRAPREVVDRDRVKREEVLARIEKIKANIERL